MDTIDLDPEVNSTENDLENWWWEVCPDDAALNVDYGPKFKVCLYILDQCEKLGEKV